MLSQVAVGLGSNLGDRRANIARAVDAVRRISTLVKVSSTYETAPAGWESQPQFLNAACVAWTRLDPFELWDSMRRTQTAVSGERAFVNGPRALDIDVLLWGDAVIDAPGLAIPHPRLADREFVLRPLAEIAPGLLHPVLKTSVLDLLARISRTGQVNGLAGPLGPRT